MKWLYRIFALFKCRHRWVIFNTTRVFERADDKLPCKHVYTLQCRICGDMKTKESK